MIGGSGSMTSIPMVPVAWFGEVSLGTTANNSFTLIPTTIAPKPATFDRLGKIRMGNRLSWRFRQKKRRSRQNPRSATHGLGKTFGKPFMMAISPRKAALMPKPATRLGKIEAARLSWRSRFFPMASSPKPAHGVGKFPAKPVYLGDREAKRDWIGEAIRIGKPLRIGETIRDAPCRRSDRPQGDRRGEEFLKRDVLGLTLDVHASSGKLNPSRTSAALWKENDASRCPTPDRPRRSAARFGGGAETDFGDGGSCVRSPCDPPR